MTIYNNLSMDEIFLEFNEIQTENPGIEYLEVPEAHESPDKKYVCVCCDKKYQAVGSGTRDQACCCRNNDPLDQSQSLESAQHDIPRQERSAEQSQSVVNQSGTYSCDFDNCSKTFSLYAHLQKHIKNHKALFQCNFQNCEQKFTLKSNLRRHEKIHTREKPFLCHECEKGFATTTNLRQHLQVHLGQNKREIYECAVNGCNKKYFYLCNLKKHKKEHAEQQDSTLPEEFSISALFNGCKIEFTCRAIPNQESLASSELAYILPANMENQESLDNLVFYGTSSADLPAVLCKAITLFLERAYKKVFIKLPEEQASTNRISGIADSVLKEICMKKPKAVEEITFCDLKVEEFMKATDFVVEKIKRKGKDQQEAT